jgi:large subunit ribosomal protein L33
MAKAKKEAVNLVSSEGTGFAYVYRRNRSRGRGNQKKVAVMKYDPIARKHVLFEEKKLSRLKKRYVRAVEAPAK